MAWARRSLLGMLLMLEKGRRFRATRSSPSWSRFFTSAMTRISAAARSRARRRDRSLPTMTIAPIASSSGATNGKPLTDRSAAGQVNRLTRASHLSQDALRDERGDQARAMESIRAELDWWRPELEKQGKIIEAQRLYHALFRPGDDEGDRLLPRHRNYSPLLRRLPGEAPPPCSITCARCAHVPRRNHRRCELHGMYHGDRSRKEVLVGHGFRLPARSTPSAHFRGIRAPRQPTGLCVARPAV